ncbi:major capsid protein [Dyella terrae]|uniref:major capsid protein n=1 Tax=Dyella terrae TaxID=522259 RepID=UPI001EFDD6B7|nr:major capsid protein [Dyella terrae]ULU23794.1 hypothetical protein DYST_00692 [Dyella terrae]
MLKFVKNVRFGAEKVAVAAGGLLMSGFAMADASADPTTTITGTLATYATDVGLIAVAVLTIVYGKKLVSYLRV